MRKLLIAVLLLVLAGLGVVAMLGNHDNWTGPAAVRDQFRRARVTVLENQAIARGPLAIGVIGDRFSYYSDIPATLRALQSLPGGRVFLTHSPSITPLLP